jgi:hypothetical protein
VRRSTNRRCPRRDLVWMAPLPACRPVAAPPQAPPPPPPPMANRFVVGCQYTVCFSTSSWTGWGAGHRFVVGCQYTVVPPPGLDWGGGHRFVVGCQYTVGYLPLVLTPLLAVTVEPSKSVTVRWEMLATGAPQRTAAGGSRSASCVATAPGSGVSTGSLKCNRGFNRVLKCNRGFNRVLKMQQGFGKDP